MEKMQVPIHMCPEKMFKSLGGKKDDFCDTVLMCGQRHRVDMVLDRLDDVKKIFGFSGHSVFRAKHCGQDLLVANSGMYAPDTAIVMELLSCAGVKNYIRLGSCGALSAKIKVGDIVIAESAMVGEGTSRYYLEANDFIQSDMSLISILKSNIKDSGVFYGSVWTTDALFREIPKHVDPMIAEGAIAVDMVSSALLAIAKFYSHRAVSLLAVSDNVVKGISGFKSKEYKETEKIIIDYALKYLL